MKIIANSNQTSILEQIAYPAIMCFPLGGELLGRVYPDVLWILRFQSLLGLMLGALFLHNGLPWQSTWIYLSMTTAFGSVAIRPIFKKDTSHREHKAAYFIFRSVAILVGILHLLPPVFYLKWGNPAEGFQMSDGLTLYPAYWELFLFMTLIVAWILLLGYAFRKTPMAPTQNDRD